MAILAGKSHDLLSDHHGFRRLRTNVDNVPVSPRSANTAQVFESLSHLDAVGNTLKATQILRHASARSRFVLFATFLRHHRQYRAGFDHTLRYRGLFVVIACLFDVLNRVRALPRTLRKGWMRSADQFRQNPAILEGKANPITVIALTLPPRSRCVKCCCPARSLSSASGNRFSIRSAALARCCRCGSSSQCWCLFHQHRYSLR